MARIAGVDLPQGKHVVIALTYIFGIGRTRAGTILSTANVEGSIKVKDLAEDIFIMFANQRGPLRFVG